MKGRVNDELHSPIALSLAVTIRYFTPPNACNFSAVFFIYLLGKIERRSEMYLDPGIFVFM